LGFLSFLLNFSNLTSKKWNPLFQTLPRFRTSSPVGWRCAQSDWVSQEDLGDVYFSMNNETNFYNKQEIENLVKEVE